MKSIKSIFFAALLLSIPVASLAATLIESRDSEQTSILYIEGTKMRGQSPGEPGYMLINTSDKTMYIVDPQRKLAIDSSSVFMDAEKKRTEGGGQAPVVKFVHKGSGPEIAGYNTEHYARMAGDRHCEDVFVSRKALKEANVLAWMKGMESGAFSSSGGDEEDCDWETPAMRKFYRDKGYPLKSLDENGKVIDEVVRIVSNAKVPAGGFSVPDGYRVVTMQQLMSEAMAGGGMTGSFGMGGSNDDDDEEVYDEDEYEDESDYDEQYDDESDYDEQYDDESAYDDEDSGEEGVIDEAEEKVEKVEKVKGLFRKLKNLGN